VSTVAAGVGAGVGVGDGFFAMLLETPPQPENASSAKVNRVKTELRISNAEQRGMQNSFREQAQLINVMRAAENGIAEFSRFESRRPGNHPGKFRGGFRAGVTVIFTSCLRTYGLG
jgi:hypothetical protein